MDAGGVVRTWNTVAEDLLEISAAAALGRTFRELDASYRLSGAARALESVMTTGTSARLTDAVLTRRDGETRPVGLMLYAFGSDSDVLVLVDEFSVAEAASLRVEVALLGDKLHEALETADATHDELTITTEELRVTIAELQTRIEELEAARAAGRHKDQFLAMLAHELRAPLSPLLNAARILRRSIVGQPALMPTVDIIERQVAHQARLLDDLLDMSRIVHGRIELVRAPCALQDVVDEAVETVRPLAGERRHHVGVSALPEALIVDGDRARLVQIIGNLLHNAVKFTPPGGSIDVNLAREDGVAVLRVQDNGLGIPAEQLDVVFELFEQGDSSPARSAGGLGLGLTLVRSLVTLHGGTVEAHSAGRGQGSEFVVRLPLAAGEQPVSAAPLSSPGRTYRILIVEDNVDTRESLRLTLELDGHHVETAEDGTSGSEAALASRPEVVFLDIGLPGLDGYEVTRRLRDALGKSVWIVALTGYGRSEDRAKGMTAGVDAYLIKPVSADELTRVLTALEQEKR